MTRDKALQRAFDVIESVERLDVSTPDRRTARIVVDVLEGLGLIKFEREKTEHEIALTAELGCCVVQASDGEYRGLTPKSARELAEHLSRHFDIKKKRA